MSKRNCYKFAHHDRVKDEPPETDITRFLDKAFSDEELTRKEKDKIAHILYNYGRNDPTYRLAGWAWPMRKAKQIRRILVHLPHYGWKEFYAPDKTSLRKALTPKPTEMHYLDRKEISKEKEEDPDREEKIDKLAQFVVDGMDMDTLAEYAKSRLEEYYRSLSKEELVSVYKEEIGEEENVENTSSQ